MANQRQYAEQVAERINISEREAAQKQGRAPRFTIEVSNKEDGVTVGLYDGDGLAYHVEKGMTGPEAFRLVRTLGSFIKNAVK